MHLIIITSSFPFGHKETYFANELPYLAREFDQIYLLPIYNPTGSNERRDVPDNVVVLSPILKQGFARLIQGVLRFKLSYHFWKEFLDKKVYLDAFKLKSWLNSVFLFNSANIRLEKLLKEQNLDYTNTILYSYWARAPFFLSANLKHIYKVLRMHGGDFYLERNRGYLPLQREIFDNSDVLLPISKDISEQLSHHYEQSQKKIRLSYLGTENSEISSCWVPDEERNAKIRIVSCSNIISLKRIHLIYEILKNIKNIDVEWFHIGDGEKKQELINDFKSQEITNLKWTFVGQLSQIELKQFYRDNYFDWFINVSQYEGLPVSIMEAFSFGIPAVATDVGGTSEIVDNENGILIDIDFNPKLIADAIMENRAKHSYLHKRVKAFETWYGFFNAERNYSMLASYLKDKI